MKKVLWLLVSVVILVGCIFLCACNSQNGNSINSESNAPTINEKPSQEKLLEYALAVKNKAGNAIKNVSFVICSADGQIVYEGITDANGNGTIQLAEGGEYVIKLTGVPIGYLTEEEYHFENQNTEIVLSSQVIADSMPDNTYYQLGNIVYDFTCITADGKKFTLSEVLKEKKAVMLAFPYTGDSSLISNMDAIHTAYKSFQDDICVLHVFLGEQQASEYMNKMGPDYLATTHEQIGYSFYFQGYPTEIIIDRYGVLSMQSSGGPVPVEYYENAFRYFSAEDYVPNRLFDDVGRIPCGIAPEDCSDHRIVICTIITEATCATAGTRTGYCWYCSTEMEEEYYAEHDYTFGVCVKCGKSNNEE